MATTERADIDGATQEGRPAGEAPASSPRPTFDEPTAIPYSSARLHLWGDDEAGRVPDWIYVSSEKIHHLVFALPPGRRFTHSDQFRTVFAADELLYVLSGRTTRDSLARRLDRSRRGFVGQSRRHGSAREGHRRSNPVRSTGQPMRSSTPDNAADYQL
jgi:hypothetical protein